MTKSLAWRAHESEIRGLCQRFGIRIEETAKAVRLRGPHVDLLVRSLRSVSPADLLPDGFEARSRGREERA